MTAVRSTQRSWPQTVRPVTPLATAPGASTAAASAPVRTARGRRRRAGVHMPLLHRSRGRGSLPLPVQDLLAALELEGPVHAHARGVLARPAVDRAVAVVGPDEVLAPAGPDDRRAVAGIDEVVARPADQHVLLAAV